MRVLVCGGRDYDDRAQVFSVLSDLLGKHGALTVIQGGAKGADEHARDWAIIRRQTMFNVPADWKAHGKAAGPLRNQKMIDKYQPALVVAFPGGRGTADMVQRARVASIEVFEVMQVA